MTKLAELIYKKLKQVPKGYVTTYKLLANACNTKAYQAVGQILKRNPMAPLVPCHRVVKHNAEIGGFMGKINSNQKKQILIKEGIIFKKNKIIDFKKRLYYFK